jgi:hypothetical protein
MGRRMVMVFAQGLRDRGNTLVPGTMGLKYLGSTPGQVGVSTRDIGKMVRDMDWAWSHEGDGYTEESGLKGSRVDMGLDSQPAQPLSTRELGLMDFKTATVQKHMLMEEPTRANG